ncbi:hypothetical protein C3L23_00750 [Nautilia sp. PV-1]|uniref:hypothetical protein n=1 Tax=Nautilia sp. PV-1 TaxID=2579250 RepID=UPI000FDB4DF8|nr:hypothetical protein [Nautilia sp. PV-1]AZV45854.1 hypothetical protein C3L23_00750 [Nautilia sp. PV-1]
MKFEILNKIMFGIFELFILFVAIFALVTTFMSNPLVSTVIFFFLIYFAYYLAIKYFMEE